MLRARRGHVEQALDLVPLLARIERLQVVVGRVRVPPGFLDRRHQERAVGARLPAEERRVARSRHAVQAGHDHGRELQALRLVDRHHLQLVRGAEVGRAVQVLEMLLEPRGIGQVAGLGDDVEAVEERLRILELRRPGEARGAAEREPRALDALAQRAAQPLLDRAGEDLRRRARVARARPATAPRAFRDRPCVRGRCARRPPPARAGRPARGRTRARAARQATPRDRPRGRARGRGRRGPGCPAARRAARCPRRGS